MLRKFDRQDLVDLHRLVMKRFEDTTPEGYNLLVWGDLKVLFEPNVEDEIWSNQQDWNLISWKLYESCGIYTLLMDGTLTCFNMLVEKRVILLSIHSDEWKSFQSQRQTALRVRFITTCSCSSFKDIDFRNPDIKDLPYRNQYFQGKSYQGRLLASFQDDAKYEHVGIWRPHGSQMQRDQDYKEMI
ncbi:hypothetical protein Tco_0570655 [Tanacetum coccineum]